MPILKSAKKALRSSLRKEVINLRIKKKLKRALREFKKQATEKKLSQAYAALDKACKKKVIAKNKSARLKAKLVTRLRKNQPAKKATQKSLKNS